MLTVLSRNSHPRHWTEMIVVSTLWPIYIRRMSPQYPFCRKFYGSQRQSGYCGGNDSSFARLQLNLVPISSPFTVLPELPWRFLLKSLHLHFVFAKLNEGMLLHCCLVTATTRIFLSTSCFLHAIYLQRPKSILLHFSLFSYTLLLLSHASFVSLSVHLSLSSVPLLPGNKLWFAMLRYYHYIWPTCWSCSHVPADNVPRLHTGCQIVFTHFPFRLSKRNGNNAYHPIYHLNILHFAHTQCRNI